MSFVLTETNYFSPDRPHISNSMVSDYVRSPEFYKKKYIDKIIPKKVSEPMKRGSLVDRILTQGTNLPYRCKVLKRDDPDEFLEQKEVSDDLLLSTAYWNQAQQISTDVLRSQIWNENLEEAEFQVLLKGEIDELPVCGMADRIDRLGGQRYRLIDLKVVQAQKVSSPSKWLHTCLDFGYLRKLALYQHLFALDMKIPSEYVECGHIAAAYVEEGLTDVKAFTISQFALDAAFDEILAALSGIKMERFVSHETSWQDAIQIGTTSE